MLWKIHRQNKNKIYNKLWIFFVFVFVFMTPEKVTSSWHRCFIEQEKAGAATIHKQIVLPRIHAAARKKAMLVTTHSVCKTFARHKVHGTSATRWLGTHWQQSWKRSREIVFLHLPSTVPNKVFIVSLVENSFSLIIVNLALMYQYFAVPTLYLPELQL